MRIEGRTRTLTAAVVSLAVLLLQGCGTGNGETSDLDQTASTLLVRAAPVHLTSSYRVRETYAGRVESSRSSDLGFDRSGRVVPCFALRI